MSDLQERIVASTTVFAGRLLKVNVEEVTLADGQAARREVVYHPGAVAAVPLLEDGKVVLVRQFRLPARKVLLEIPAGTLSPGETPEDCYRRELAEEIGLAPGHIEPLCSIYLAPGYSNELIHLFLARDFTTTWAQADADERLEKVEVPLAEALALIGRGEIEDAKTIVGLFLTAQKD
jgi:nudix-type nucleoside diphosphatase (YffH/AdpP family)